MSISHDLGFYSYFTTFLCFLLLTLALLVSWHKRSIGTPIVLAVGLTALWAGVISAGHLFPYPLTIAYKLAELARTAAWLYLLISMVSTSDDSSKYSGRLLTSRNLAAFAIIIAIFIIFEQRLARSISFIHVDDTLLFFCWVSAAILGLILLEQLFRTASVAQRWAIKYLCLAVGGILIYDFFLYAEALLFQKMNPVLWQARGFVNALAIPFIAISISRIPDWNTSINISRQVVYHSITLLGAGIYLIGMAVAGYFIKFWGGSWGAAIQIVFLSASFALLFALLFSGQIRAKTRVFLSKHFFSYKYDYRQEWQRFTGLLGSGFENVPDSIVRAIGNLVDSTGGILWAKASSTNYVNESRIDLPQPPDDSQITELAAWLEKTQWVIDIDEYKLNRSIYSELELPAWLLEMPKAWLIIPLILNDELTGIILLNCSDTHGDINWEDRDLLKMAGVHAASHLSQFQANRELVEARQFEAFNRLSAYVIHDLKNILAQQSLLVANAEKHKQNPVFVDDMILTIKNSVGRMTRLMEQMRSELRGKAAQSVDLLDILHEAIVEESHRRPIPKLIGSLQSTIIYTEPDRLRTVFGHILQNAQEATTENGNIHVRIHRSQQSISVEIEDDGKGMDHSFLQERLFKPFDSTKGLTGMGIGAFESREFIRKMGGDIQVRSEIGKGSVFRVVIPCDH